MNRPDVYPAMARCIRGHPGISQCVSLPWNSWCATSGSVSFVALYSSPYPRPRSQLSCASARHSRPPRAGGVGAAKPKLPMRPKSLGRYVSQPNPGAKPAASSLVGLLRNRSRRSPSRLQFSLGVRAATCTPGEGRAEPMTSLTAFASVDAPFETSAPGGVGACPARSSFSTSAFADWAWTPLPCAVRNERHPSSDPIRWAIR